MTYWYRDAADADRSRGGAGGRCSRKNRRQDMLKVTLKEGESLAIGGNITVELKQIATSRRATILIDAPREVLVKRQKVGMEYKDYG